MAQIEYLKAEDKNSWLRRKRHEIIEQKCRIVSILLDNLIEDFDMIIQY